MEKDEWMIHELAELAGVTVRTIRYYTIEGLLPPPLMRGKFACYTQAHLRRLELIRQLKDAYLPLREIRQTMSGLSDEEVQERLNARAEQIDLTTPLPPAPADDKSSAMDYIARLMGRQAELRTPGSSSQPKPPGLHQLPPAVKAVEQTWRRVELAPGIEVHIRQPFAPLAPHEVQSILNHVRNLLQSSGGTP